MSISQDSAATIVCREVFDETSHPTKEGKRIISVCNYEEIRITASSRALMFLPVVVVGRAVDDDLERVQRDVTCLPGNRASVVQLIDVLSSIPPAIIAADSSLRLDNSTWT